VIVVFNEFCALGDSGHFLGRTHMPSRNPTEWMWAQACGLLEQAEHMHRQFFQLSTAGTSRVIWEPPVDIFEDHEEIVVVVALPGVARDSIEIISDAGTLVIRAQSNAAFAAIRGARSVIKRLEIPYGTFERRIALPDVRLQPGTRELRDGCLILRLRKGV
jgi:HSP20 family molecular chaperone IbpA